MMSLSMLALHRGTESKGGLLPIISQRQLSQGYSPSGPGGPLSSARLKPLGAWMST